jgi:hypothetical protein
LFVQNFKNLISNNNITSVEIPGMLIFSAGASYAQINLIVLKSNNLVTG